MTTDNQGVEIPAFRPKHAKSDTPLKILGWPGLFSSQKHLLPISQGLQTKGYETQEFPLYLHDEKLDFDTLISKQMGICSLDLLVLEISKQLANTIRQSDDKTQYFLYGHSLAASALMGLLTVIEKNRLEDKLNSLKWLQNFEPKVQHWLFNQLQVLEKKIRGVILLAPGPMKGQKIFNFKFWRTINKAKDKPFKLEENYLRYLCLNQHEEAHLKPIYKIINWESPLAAHQFIFPVIDGILPQHIPVLLIGGGKDHLVPEKVWKKFHKKFPHTEYNLIKDADHWLVGPQHVATTAHLIDEFIQKHI